MLLIISEEVPTVGEIMKWLDAYGVPFRRFNHSDRAIQDLSIRIGRDGTDVQLVNEEGPLDLGALTGAAQGHRCDALLPGCPRQQVGSRSI
jgi:hypothetical protein